MFIIRLPQLAVLAKILCLLMVVMCGAVPAMVRSVSLYSTCSSGNVTVHDRYVMAVGRSEKNAAYQKLSTQSDDFSGKLYIFAEESERYICFNKRWKLVGLPKKRKGPMCQFYEEYNGSYLRYRSAVDGSHYLGFNKRGMPLKDAQGREQCLNFIKYNPHFNINHHNILVASNIGGELRKPAMQRTPKKYRTSERGVGWSAGGGGGGGRGGSEPHHHHRHNRGKMHEQPIPRRRLSLGRPMHEAKKY
ncbi:fibroblast growth factor 18 isoform X2 [Athalia rosae]|uniref:fibroblast growth factor 18 isoform X2 n=1 Tax=Athalia rosae TaxID=37344 RepID=UPI0006255E2F|nr:fibroblast growth factor 18 isoform X2 [Athalia rosae]